MALCCMIVKGVRVFRKLLTNFGLFKIYLDQVKTDPTEHLKQGAGHDDFVEDREQRQTFKGLAVVVPSQKLKSRCVESVHNQELRAAS